MKKIKLIILLVCSFLLLTGFTSPYRKTNEELFMELQDNITETLQVENGKYIFNEEKITSLVNDSSVNFEKFNLTKESFIETAIYNIKNTKIFSVTPTNRGIYCNRNYTTGGWNYDRFFNSKTKTQELIDDLHYAASNWTAISGVSGLLTAFLGPIGTVIAAGVASGSILNSWYASLLAKSLEVKNRGYCGTVTDINKFTSIFKIWSQEEF